MSNSINATTPITAKNQIILNAPSKFKEWDEEFLFYTKDLNFKNYFLGIEPLQKEPAELRLVNYALSAPIRNIIKFAFEAIEKFYKGFLETVIIPFLPNNDNSIIDFTDRTLKEQQANTTAKATNLT